MQRVLWLLVTFCLLGSAGPGRTDDYVHETNPKILPDGALVELRQVSVTYATIGRFYVEAADRAWGVRVESLYFSPSVDDVLTLRGRLRTNLQRERYVDLHSMTVAASREVSPLFLPPSRVGGTDFHLHVQTGAGQAGTLWGKGLNNVGMLVKTAAAVSYVDPFGLYFNLDDGGGVRDPDGRPGLRVEAPGLTQPRVGDTVAVTGVASLYRSSGVSYPRLLARNGTDMEWLATTGRGPAPPTDLVAQRDINYPWMIRLSWQLSSTQGVTQYTINRRLHGETEFSWLATVSTALFADFSIPGSKASQPVEYYVEALGPTGYLSGRSNIAFVPATDQLPPPP